jgi:hypothetical protein
MQQGKHAMKFPRRLFLRSGQNWLMHHHDLNAHR